MKLKKIASLMLAGIMAVSMLAGCKTADNGGNGGNGEGDGTQTSGYSAVMAQNVSDKVKDMDFVTFQDNAADETALKNSLNMLGKTAIENASKHQTPYSLENVTSQEWEAVVNYLIDGFKSNGTNMEANGMDLHWWNEGNENMLNRDVKYGVVYVIDGNVGMTEAVKMVTDKLDSTFQNLKESVESTNSKTTYDYSYVISVSTASRTIGDNSANFIAVTIDRTVVEG